MQHLKRFAGEGYFSMSAFQDDQKFAQLVRKLDPQSKLLRTWALKGGVSAQVTALEIEQANGQTKKLLVRQHGETDRKHNPRIAADEFRLLQQLKFAGLAVPTPYYVDESSEIFSTPYIILEYVEGEAEFAPADLGDFLRQAAIQLARIHALDSSALDLSFLPLLERKYAEKFRERPAKVDESLDEGRIRDVLEAAWPLKQHNPSVLLHGDFWPGNLLWKEGQLVAVVDWENAEIGDPLADLANTRLEILWSFGADAMEQFTWQYRSVTAIDFAHLPYWDLCAALRPSFKIGAWAGNAAIELRMRERHGWFVRQAFEKLPKR